MARFQVITYAVTEIVDEDEFIARARGRSFEHCKPVDDYYPEPARIWIRGRSTRFVNRSGSLGPTSARMPGVALLMWMPLLAEVMAAPKQA